MRFVQHRPPFVVKLLDMPGAHDHLHTKLIPPVMPWATPARASLWLPGPNSPQGPDPSPRKAIAYISGIPYQRGSRMNSKSGSP